MINFFQKAGFYIKGSHIRLSGAVVFIALFFSSCTISKPSSYFTNIKSDTVLAFTNATNDELKIRKGDVLNISVSSLSKLEDELFNTAVSSTSAASSGYEVGKEGEIYFHKVGKLTAEGLTRKQLKAKLEDELKPYLKEPMAVINFRNHHVTILGDISRPQILPMPEEKVSLLDVIAQSGTTTAMTALQRVLVIREKDNAKEFKYINLEDHSLFNSSFYYLQPNDIVVLNPDEKRVMQDLKRTRYQQVSTLILQAVTAVLVIYQAFFK